MNMLGQEKKFAPLGRFVKKLVLPLGVVVLLMTLGVAVLFMWAEEPGKAEDAAASHDEIAQCSDNNNSSDAHEQAARALVDKGVALMGQSRVKEEIALYDEVVRRFGNDDSPGARAQVARALSHKGFALWDDTQLGEAIGIFDEIIQRFDKDKSPCVRVWVAEALNFRGDTHYLLTRPLNKLVLDLIFVICFSAWKR